MCLFWGQELYTSIKMKKAKHEKQRGNPTLGLALANVAHIKHSMQSEFIFQELYDYFLRDSLGLVSGVSYRRKCLTSFYSQSYPLLNLTKTLFTVPAHMYV